MDTSIHDADSAPTKAPASTAFVLSPREETNQMIEGPELAIRASEPPSAPFSSDDQHLLPWLNLSRVAKTLEGGKSGAGDGRRIRR